MSHSNNTRPSSALIGWTFATICVATVFWAFRLESARPETYYLLIQEDGPVEWATFWCFIGAGLVSLHSSIIRRTGNWRACYQILLGLGCLTLAMEEISWAQRLLALQPPDAFLSGNYQQELNLHNFADREVRELALITLLGGFGIAFPALGRWPPAARWLGRVDIPPPPLTLVPAFGAAIWLYLSYPWQSTGEWVELLMGLGFLHAAAAGHPALRQGGRGMLALPCGLALGFVTPWLVPDWDDAARLAAAARETRALAADFSERRLRSRCGVHKRLHTFVVEYGGNRLEQGAFARLAPDPASSPRRDRYLDPWNLPYWIRHSCSRDRQQSTVYVYSFGPNRRRDSTPGKLLADDIGAFVGRSTAR